MEGVVCSLRVGGKMVSLCSCLMVLIVASNSVDAMAEWWSAHNAERVLLMTFNWSENRIGIPSVGCTPAMGLSMLKFIGMVDI
jgi:hypothetical protein